MSSTTIFDDLRTLTHGGKTSGKCPGPLLDKYSEIVNNQRFSWTAHHRFLRKLGSGGQGIVYLTERRGTDNFTLPVALKIFSPERFDTLSSYEDSMAQIARVAARVAQIQQDNLLDVNNFVDAKSIRMMEMEWIDGYDLAELLTLKMLDRLRHRVSVRRWEYMNNVIVTSGPIQARLKPGVAVAIVRDCLAALAALHRENIVHGDIKPANIMLKRTGNAKIIDIGSAFELDDVPAMRTITPTYAAPEILEGGDHTPRSDLASLGYTIVEMLSGMPVFAGHKSVRELLEAKRLLAQRLPKILPQEVVCNELLMNFCRGLIAPDPARRFPSAEAADMLEEGAAGFHRQLVISNLASEYENELRLWLEELD